MEKYLDEDHDTIIDIHFRYEGSGVGPPGWNVLVERTILGQSSTHGINFGTIAAPTAKDVGSAARLAVQELEKAATKASLIVKPGDGPKGSLI